MKRIMGNIARVALASALATMMVPAAALATGGDGASRFVSSDGGRTATAQTNVYVMVTNNGFGIIDQSDTLEKEDLNQGIWVQVQKGTAPYTATWSRVSIDANGKRSNDGVVGTSTWSNSGNVAAEDYGKLRWYPGADDAAIGPLMPNFTYEYSAVVTDSSSPANTAATDRPITVMNKNGYTAGPKTWTASGANAWTWSVEGAAAKVPDGHEMAPFGTDGKIRSEAILSATPVGTSQSGVYGAFDSFAKAQDPAQKMNAAWQVKVTNAPEGQAAFAGTIAVRLDVTDEVAKGVRLGSMKLLWANPYTSPATVVAVGGTGATGFPYGASTYTADGRSYLMFLMPSELAGQTGNMGAFAVTSPVGLTYKVSAEASEGGKIDPAGEKAYDEGSEPAFVMYPDAEAGYELDRVEVAYAATATDAAATETLHVGDTSARGAKLSGNQLALAPLGSAVSVQAFFKKADYPEPAPGDETVTYKVTLAGPSAGQGSMEAVGYEGASPEVDATKPLVLQLHPANGYEAEKVVVDYGAASGIEPSSVEYAVEGDYLQIPVLKGPATITPSFKESEGQIVTQQHNVFAEAGEGGTASASSAKVDHGKAVTFTGIPDANHKVASAQVFDWDAVAKQWVAGMTYPASDLSAGTGDAGTLTLYNILGDTKVVFSFAAKGMALEVPAQVEHATISPAGTLEVVYGKPAEVIVTVDDGYQLAAGGLKVTSSDGSKQHALTATDNGDGTYTVQIPYEYVADLGEGARLECAPTKEPINGRPTTEEPSEVVVGGDEVDVPIVVNPDGPGQVVDEVKVDGYEILDKDGGELKDKLTETDGDGLKYSPDIPGIKYDPSTGEYIIDNGDGTETRFVYDPETGTITFTEVPGDNTHTVTSTAVAGTAVTIRTVAGSAVGGIVIPSQSIPWKNGRDLTIVVQPDDGYEVDKLFVMNNEIKDLKDAAAEHVEAARAAYAAGLIWGGMARAQALAALNDAGSPSLFQAEPVRDVAAALTGAETAHADTVVKPGSKYHVVPGSTFNSASGITEVVIEPRFKLKGSVGSGETATHSVTATVKGGHGYIDSPQVQKVPDGGECTVRFVPDAGYQVVAVTVDGQRRAHTARSLTLANVRADRTVEVEFGPLGYAGDNGTVQKALRTLRSLASTGDLNGPAMLGLMAVACASLGTVVLVTGRRRREEEAQAADAE